MGPTMGWLCTELAIGLGCQRCFLLGAWLLVVCVLMKDHQYTLIDQMQALGDKPHGGVVMMWPPVMPEVVTKPRPIPLSQVRAHILEHWV